MSDGSKCDTGNILDIFGADNRIAVQDPVYPVYVDTNVMAGRTGAAFAAGGVDTGFVAASSLAVLAGAVGYGLILLAATSWGTAASFG